MDNKSHRGITNLRKRFASRFLSIAQIGGLLFLVLKAKAQSPDLVPVDLSWPGVLTADQDILFSAAVTNLGPGSTGLWQFTERMALCRTNTLLDTNQIIQNFLIYDGVNRNVPSGGAYTNSRSIIIPGSIAAGNYYLILEANLDPRTGFPLFSEVTRTNNILVKQVTVSFPDLAPLSLSWPGALVAGQDSTFSGVITNYGLGTAGPRQFSERVTLCRTNTLADTNQIVQSWKIFDFTTHLVTAGSSYTNGSTRTLPNTITPGIYYLILEANLDPSTGLPLFSEVTRTNNTLIKQVSIGLSDLTPSSLTASNTLGIANSPLFVSYTVVNTSSNTLNSGWSDRFVFSTTSNLGGALSTNIYNESPVLAPGGSYSRTRAVNVPPVVPGTNYFIILDVDSANTVPEENETNNRRFLQISLTNQLPTITLLSPSGQVQTTSCVPTRFILSAAPHSGSYAITNVIFLDNSTNLIAQITHPPYVVNSFALTHGDHVITARAFDDFGFKGDSTQSVTISLRWPTSLHVIMANLATNGNFVGCMCAYPDSNYVIEAADNLQSPILWLPYVTNRAGPDVVAFTNNSINPMRFFRARLQ